MQLWDNQMATPLTGLNVDHSMDNLRDPSVTEPATHIRQRFHVPSEWLSGASRDWRRSRQAWLSPVLSLVLYWLVAPVTSRRKAFQRPQVFPPPTDAEWPPLYVGTGRTMDLGCRSHCGSCCPQAAPLSWCRRMSQQPSRTVITVVKRCTGGALGAQRRSE